MRFRFAADRFAAVRAAVRAAVVGVVVALISLAAGVSPLSAQRVEGRITEAASGAPVAGAVVSTLDSTGRTVSRTVSGVDGRYRLASSAAVAELRVIHIGFRPFTKAITPLASSTATTVDVTLTRLPTLLESVTVIDQPRCPAVKDGPATFALWEQARQALLATVVAREANPARVRMVSYDRELSPDGARIVRQAISETLYVATDPVVSRRNAAEYATLGYRDADRTRGTERYYAPDAEALLDSAFVQGHCMSLAAERADHPDQIGLAFAPVPSDARTDTIVNVAGVIWIGSRSRLLRSVEFHFTHVNRVAVSADSLAGGGMWYEEMPNGLSLPVRWNLHVPIPVRQAVRVRGVTVLTSEADIAGVRDAGGELSDARWSDGTTWDAKLPRIHGRVVTLGGAGAVATPVVGAEVGIRGTSIQTATDSLGVFELRSVVPGRYAVEALDASLSDFNLSTIASAEVAVDRAHDEPVTLSLPSRAKIVDSLCAESRVAIPGSPLAATLVLGRVLLPSGDPAAGALVRARWTAPATGGAAQADASALLSGRADSTGTFEICGAPTGTRVSLSATNDSLVSLGGDVSLRAEGDVARLTLRLVRAESAALPAYRRRAISVLDDASSSPLPDAEISSATDDRVIGRTSPGGRLSLATLPEGNTLLRIRRPGYEQRLMTVTIQPTDTSSIALRLRSVTQLAAVRVTATSVNPIAVRSGFEDRRKLGLGHFALPSDFTKRPGQPISATLRWLGVKSALGGATSEILLGGHARPCPVTIYIDGLLYWSGASRTPPPDAGRFRTDDFSAAEYFADGSEIPAEYSQTDSGCGVLLLWSRF